MSRSKIPNNKTDTLSIGNPESQFRQDIVSGDWILIASGREDYFKKVMAKRKEEAKKAILTPGQIQDEIKTCPFEEPQKSGNEPAVWRYPKEGEKWKIQIIPNKYPSVATHYNTCPVQKNSGPYSNMEAIGFHEIVLTRDHLRPIALLDKDEIKILINGYKERYLFLAKEKCLKYIFIFHNSGKEAGASVSHPHSQIMALPIIPPDVRRSLDGCNNYFKTTKKCVHCASLEWELKQKERIIYQNSDFAAVCPYASRTNFEIRIFPLKHSPNFENITSEEIEKLAGTMKYVFKSIYDKLENPAYNFFIHTAPLFDGSLCYHWHIEIFPRVSIWAGFELGTGIEVVYVTPEKAAKIFKVIE